MFYWNEYDRYLERQGLVFSSRRVHRYSISHFFAYLDQIGVRDVRAVTSRQVADYLATHRDRGHAPSTIAGQLGRLQAYFGFLHRERIIFGVPGAEIEPPKYAGRGPLVLPADEMRTILDSVATEPPLAIRGKAILELTYSSALRPREVRALKISDIDFRKGLLFIEQSKNRKDRIVPAGSVALGWVKTYLKLVRPALIHGQTHPVVFVAHDTGRPLSAEGLRWVVRETYRKSGLRPVPLKVMRACAASNLLDAGMGLVHIARFLGHVDVKTTLSYLKIRERELGKVLEKAHDQIRKRYNNGGSI